ncbi:hypothetical protein ACFV9D_05510 [Streptomyces sp. NPDC059875]|uniref:hypothetical protein n=1 Tax=unclassified Streptomyces TaxID=2593676 RepID=UPI0036592DE5
MILDLATPTGRSHGIASFARDGLSVAATPDDANHWVDGFCWLYCGLRWTRVL